ncbi:MAG: hypothetical protein HC916_00885 [Coleofasciculaceae cyanobacterium SM2_1_6]|nr:hypothetical protein [Coleofasciculaceae cyanobacterium SM2_1_6]
MAQQVVQTEDGYLVFDDTVLDKNPSFAIELVKRQFINSNMGCSMITFVNNFRILL